MEKFIIRGPAAAAATATAATYTPPPPPLPPTAADLAMRRVLSFRRLFVERTKLDPSKKPARRPTKEEVGAYELYKEQRNIYEVYTGPLSLQDWWAANNELVHLETTLPTRCEPPPSEAVEEEDDGEGGGGLNVTEKNELARHHYRSDIPRMLYQAYLHKWNRDGSHGGWQTGLQFSLLIKHALGHDVAVSTAYRWLATEREFFEKNNNGVELGRHALLRQPNVPALLALLQKEREEALKHRVEPGSAGRFTGNIDVLIERVRPFPVCGLSWLRHCNCKGTRCCDVEGNYSRGSNYRGVGAK